MARTKLPKPLVKIITEEVYTEGIPQRLTDAQKDEIEELTHKGLSAQKIAELIGCHQSTVYNIRWERGIYVSMYRKYFRRDKTNIATLEKSSKVSSVYTIDTKVIVKGGKRVSFGTSVKIVKL